MTPSSSSQFPRTLRSHNLLFLALDYFPPLELGERATLLNPHDVAHVVLVGFIVGIIFLRAPHRLFHDWMREAALDAHHHGLVLLTADHDALERAPRHVCSLRCGLRAHGALRPCCWPRCGFCNGSRPAGALLACDRLDPGDVTTNLPYPRGIFELSSRTLKAQVKLLLLQLEDLLVELVDSHGADITRFH